MNYAEESLRMHYQWKGKIRMESAVPVRDRNELSLAYTPGVAQPCLEIQKNPDLSYELTRRWNTVAVITDGTAVLGLGDIGPEAGMPVMEGKCVLFKEFGNVDAIPLCVRTKDVDRFVEAVSLIGGSFGGINLEDIAAPRCFEIERKLKENLDIPVFHDDQHGTAVVVLSGVLNAMKLTGRKLGKSLAVINGAGSAGIAIAKLLLSMGLGDVVLCDREGVLTEEYAKDNPEQTRMLAVTNLSGKSGKLADAIRGADLFVGVSKGKLLTPEMIRSMSPDPIVFAMANPVPEIMPEEALEAGAKVIGTGRSDYPNQINNVLAFPGIFRGALDCRARDINEEMKKAAALALASLVTDEELAHGRIIPDPFNQNVCSAVASAVAKAAKETGTARI